MNSSSKTAKTISSIIKRKISGHSPEQIEEKTYMLSEHGNSVKSRSVYKYLNGEAVPGILNLIVMEEATGQDIYSQIKDKFKNGQLDYNKGKTACAVTQAVSKGI